MKILLEVIYLQSKSLHNIILSTPSTTYMFCLFVGRSRVSKTSATFSDIKANTQYQGSRWIILNIWYLITSMNESVSGTGDPSEIIDTDYDNSFNYIFYTV